MNSEEEPRLQKLSRYINTVTRIHTSDSMPPLSPPGSMQEVGDHNRPQNTIIKVIGTPEKIPLICVKLGTVLRLWLDPMTLASSA